MTPLQLRAMLYSHDHTVASWARDRGYEAATVQRVMYRWAGHDGLPRGRLTRAILRDLSLDLGISIPPSVDWAAADAVAAERPSEHPSRRVAGTTTETLPC